MPLPLIPIAIALAVAASGGAGLGIKGGLDIKDAKQRHERAVRAYGNRRAVSVSLSEDVNAQLKELGVRQESAVSEVVVRMREFLRRHEQAVSERERFLIDGLEAVLAEVGLSDHPDFAKVASAQGLVGAISAGVGTYMGVPFAVTALASASTGTAISSLSGAAATSALYAWLGGGAVAAGGGGVAVGSMMVAPIAVAPAVLVGGFVLATNGALAQTEAKRIEVATAEAKAQLDVADAKVRGVARRASEVSEVLEEMARRAVEALNSLESETFDLDRDRGRFARAMILTIAVRDLIAAPLLSPDGSASEESREAVVRYRRLIEEE